MILNAEKQRLGRLASQVAKLLIDGEKVEINNISAIEQTSKNKVYYSHSGYPGGFKKRTYEPARNASHSDAGGGIGPKKAFEKAVFGMLPKNKLRKPRIKNLIIHD